MIAKKTTGKSFKGLVNYLTNPDKMEWIEQRNCACNDPKLIAEQMEMTAEQSARIQKPVYHISLSWSQFDDHSKDQMIEVADQFLDQLGLEEHQAAIVNHIDQDHPHIHIVINRVHPETEKAWEPYLFEGAGRDRKFRQTDYQRIEEFLRATEKQNGWKVTPGKHAGQWQREFDSKAPEIWQVKQQRKSEKVAAGMGMENTDGRSVMERALELKDELYSARSFDQFDNILSRNGLWLEPKGQGMVITDGNRSIKASSVSRGLSGSRLESKFEIGLKDYARQREKKVDIAEGFSLITDWANLKEQSELESIKFLTDREYKRADAALHRLQTYDTELKSVQAEIRGSFTQLFEEGRQAYQAFGEHIQNVGFEEALADLVSSPEQFGTVKDKSAAILASDGIRSFDKLQSCYSTQIVKLNKNERCQKIDKLKAKTGHYGGIYSDISQRLFSKGLQKTEAGRATNNSVHQVIAVSRALNKIAKDPTQSPISLAKQLGWKGVSKVESEAGQALNSSVINASQYFKNVAEIISNPTIGSVKLVKGVIQSAIRQAGQASREIELGR